MASRCCTCARSHTPILVCIVCRTSAKGAHGSPALPPHSIDLHSGKQHCLTASIRDSYPHNPGAVDFDLLTVGSDEMKTHAVTRKCCLPEFQCKVFCVSGAVGFSCASSTQTSISASVRDQRVGNRHSRQRTQNLRFLRLMNTYPAAPAGPNSVDLLAYQQSSNCPNSSDLDNCRVCTPSASRAECNTRTVIAPVRELE
jgi:hypothetical protein